MNQTKIPFRILRANVRGQIALFLALAFPILFVLFAMVINVGLLVHQKINLQNSVDLAAYYGAMKQAQVMNAIAHVNYQIHQSWKLLTFRYRQLGSAGEAKFHPYDHKTSSLRPSAEQNVAFNCPTAFCVNYMRFSHMQPTEDYCQDLCTTTDIHLPGVPSTDNIAYGLAATLLSSVTASIEAYSKGALTQVKADCQAASERNWFMLAEFLWLYKADMVNRKRVLNRLANSLSYSTNDFLDIDDCHVGQGGECMGDNPPAGVYQTFYKNLTAQNQSSIGTAANGQGTSFAMYNSLGADQCAGTQGNEKTPPLWLSEVFSKPVFAYRDGSCEGNEMVKFITRIVNDPPNNLPTYHNGISADMLKFLSDYIVDPANFTSPDSRLYHTTLNYEKNPWCVAYVQVKAKTLPKIPFMPFGPVTLEASATAKPFGGSIGPWYYSTWQHGQPESQGGDQLDKALPPRASILASAAAPTPENEKADYGRYVGDDVGTKSNLTMGRMGQAIFEKTGAAQMSLNWWIDIMADQDFTSLSGNGDLLAWDKTSNTAPAVRNLEISAIIPDQFDATYYSVEPDFWRNYALRIQRRGDFQDMAVRGDIGYRKDAPKSDVPWQTMTVRDQIDLARQKNLLDYSTLSYYVGATGSSNGASFAELLTSWHYNKPGDYTIDTDKRFGICPTNAVIKPDDTTLGSSIGRAVPGSCFAGGRVGYSVKLVDPAFLSTNQELGGEGITGQILNPPSPE